MRGLRPCEAVSPRTRAVCKRRPDMHAGLAEGAAVGGRPEPSACTSGAVHAPPWLQVGPRGTATSRRDRVTGQHGPAS